jgi:voltage-gated potassium channel
VWDGAAKYIFGVKLLTFSYRAEEEYPVRRFVAGIFDRSKKPTTLSYAVNFFLFSLIILNVAAVTLESIASVRTRWQDQLTAFELVSVFIFTVEYLLRIWSAPEHQDLSGETGSQKRKAYIFSFTGVIDLLAILPYLLQLIGLSADMRMLRVLRLARLLKISHYTSALEDLMSAIYSERKAFLAALYLLILALFLSSSLIYVAENEVQPDVFSSIPETMWWSIVTLTTVGYGDVSPVTAVGKLIGAATAMMGVCSIALLTGIIGAGFSNQMSKKKAALALKVSEVLEDGVITNEEAVELARLQEKLDLSDDQMTAIISGLQNRQ